MDDELNSTRYLACTSNYGHVFDEFDIISNLYPIVPDHFYNIVESYCVLNDHLKKFSNIANGIAAFYEQNPLEIDEELGLYMEEHDRFGKKDVHIRTLNKKRSAFFLNEIRIPIKGGKVANRARIDFEKTTGQKVVTENNFLPPNKKPKQIEKK